MAKSIWEVLGFVKSQPKNKMEVLEDYRVHFAIAFKGKPNLGKIEGQAVISSDSAKNAEKHLREEVLKQLEITHPWATQACPTEKRREPETK